MKPRQFAKNALRRLANMQTANFDKIVNDVAAGLVNAEDKHPDFCQRFIPEDFRNELNEMVLAIKRQRNQKGEETKNESCEDVILEEVYEMLECAGRNDLTGVYYEARDVAVVALRIMEKVLNEKIQEKKT